MILAIYCIGNYHDDFHCNNAEIFDDEDHYNNLMLVMLLLFHLHGNPG